ncbi:hypothetical protein V498_06244 [Pseudogymnoascus sp. VKM F-4517 (FW-2822)]|nr:hypothetical protein V498_06244 [Pseudogymnoascus sp. VKM F-4517 (FW-2822)]
MLGKTLTAVALLAAQATAKIFYAGVAESGGEFGVYSNTGEVGYGLPGVFGKDYAFINKAGVDAYVDEHKANLFRVAFLLERFCPIATGLGATFDENHYEEFEEAVNYITITKGAYCILDPHNYMRYNNPSQQPMSGSIIGDTSDVTAATTAQFAAFWGELARRFKDNEKVIFGLMNEPHDMDTELVLTNNQAAVNAIRAKGANQLIIAPGNGWTGGHAWAKEYPGNSPSSSEVMYRITDPANNLAFDIHEYLDVDFSGGHLECSSLASEHLSPLTAWLKEYNFKAMITEFGAANGTQCESYVADMLDYMADNEEYIGWTAWAAGPFWGPYSPCCTDGNQYGSLEPGSKAADGGPSLYDTVWLKQMLPKLPTDLVWSGISNVNGNSGGEPVTSTSTTIPTSTFTMPSSTSTTTSPPASTTTAAAGTVPLWQQCGGMGVLQGVVDATKASTNILIEAEIWILRIAANKGVSSNCVSEASQRLDFSLNFWLSAVSNCQQCTGENNGLFTMLSLTIAVTSLQQLSRKGIKTSESELSVIWNTICDALTNLALQDSWSPSRSAQGFLSVPLCSIIKEGQIDELFRLHVWLPDYHRGNPDFAIHSHQPFVQSWILAGEGTDRQYQVDRVKHASEATHAEFGLSWSDGKNLSKEYVTHQLSSVIVNSGKLVQSTEIKSNVHIRNSSYTIPAGVFHCTEVPCNVLHATLFYFDSRRGFIRDAPVLGPINGVPVTQIRDPGGQTPKSLAESVLLVQTWEKFIKEGNKHASAAAWEHSQRAFNSALSLIDGAADLLDLKRYRALTLGELGKTNRRFGRYEVAERFLQDACAGLLNTPEHATLSGELGVVYRHMNRLSEAKDSFKLQYDTAKSLNIETEMCRAIGNLGMVNYQLWETSHDDEILELAIQQLQERVIRCENIRAYLSTTCMDATSASQLPLQLEIWAAVALARLSLCFSARGDKEESFNTAAAGLQHAKRTGDPTVIAISHFFCGRASTLKGQMEEALRSFNACEGCTPAIAFCKEPSKEHHKYLEYMVAAGANMEIMDDDGYKALDYAVFNGDKTSADLVLTGLRRQHSERGNVVDKLLQWQEEAKRRKGYRELFQEKLRPTLLAGGQDCIAKLRVVYADALSADHERRDLFDWFKTIPYPSFAGFGRLPRSSDNIAEKFTPDRQDGLGRKRKFVIFFSYRWLHPIEGPAAGMADDIHHTQYGRMKRSVEDLLIMRPDIVAEDLHVWMDFACIDQDASQKGVAALPLFLAQSDVVISLVDDQYYDRAWCCVEALMIKRLRGSYNTHLWYEQPSKGNGGDEKGPGMASYESLREVSMELEIGVAEKKLSYESDRENIIFLERQSLLLS